MYCVWASVVGGVRIWGDLDILFLTMFRFRSLYKSRSLFRCQFNQPLNTERIIMFLFISAFMCIIAWVCLCTEIKRGGGKRKMKINDICYVFRHILPASSVVCVYFPHWKSSNIEWDLWRQLTRRKKRKPVTSIFFHLMENTQVKRKMQSICLVGGKETILHIIIFNFEFSIPSAFELKCSHCCWFWSITYSVYE